MFLTFIARKRLTFAKFVSDKKGDFWFIVSFKISLQEKWGHFNVFQVDPYSKD